MSTDWFEKYGGPVFWQEFGEHFYKKVTQTPNLSRYFYGVPSSRIKEVAGDMWQVALGFTGPMSATAIRDRHTAFHISSSDFRQYLFLLKETLVEMNVKYEDIDIIEGNLEDMHDLICTDGSD